MNNTICNLNNSDIVFERDQYITFDEAEHRYTVEGYGELRPVSSIIAKFFKEFDAEYWSMRKCNGDCLAAERLREEWKSKGSLATQAGTFMHKQIEDYLNGKEEIELDCNVCFEGKHIHLNTLMNICREWEHFQAFRRDCLASAQKPHLDTPFRTEWRVYDTDARVAGTIDLLCACQDGSYSIYDWKRSNKVNPKEINRYNNGINGLEHLTDTSYSHYCLQQNLYRYILERNYGIRVKSMNLVILHPDYPSYYIAPVPRMDKEIAIMLSRI